MRVERITMSLKVLLRCQDAEFERLISMMDLESVLDIIEELQNEMHREQDKFDKATSALARITDQASAEFKRKSQELIKSQNRLALLMSRNMHCFTVSENLQHAEEVEDGSTAADNKVIEGDLPDTMTQLPKYTATSQTDTEDSNNNPHKWPTSSGHMTKKAAKTVHMSSASATQIQCAVTPTSSTKSASSEPAVIPQEYASSPKLERRVSAVEFSVASPRSSDDQVKPKRTLRVKSLSLNQGVSSSLSSPQSPNAGNIAPLPVLQPSICASTATKSKPITSPSTSLAAARQRFFASMTEAASPDNSAVSSTVTDLDKVTNDQTNQQQPTGDCGVELSPPQPYPLSPGVDDSTYYTLLMTSPRSVSSIHLSPRSDVSSTTSSPRNHNDISQLTINSILNLDIPETIVDDDCWEERGESGTCPSRAVEVGVSDKASCTTDESGFTSGSSDSDMTLAPPDVVYDYHSEDDEKVEERVHMKHWDPTKLLEELYRISLASEVECNSHDIINMEGYLERLPLGKNKNTLLKTWKRTYCRAIDGIIYFYASKTSGEAQSYMSLMGGKLEVLSNQIIGIDDMRGHYLMVRCASQLDYVNWKRSFYTQILCSPHTSYIRPCLKSQPDYNDIKTVIIDLGHQSVRAGLLAATPTYPELFFPCTTSTDVNERVVVGIEAFKPQNRPNGVHYPVASTNDIDMYRVNVQALPFVFGNVFTELRIDQSEYAVMLSCPHNFSNRLKEEVINILIGRFNVAAVNMVNQSLLVPYAYNATSGIVVDIGERIEVVAVSDGYLVEGGLSRQSYGGSRITDTINSYLTEYRLFTPVERLIARHIKEKTCFVSQDYGDDLLKHMCNETACEVSVDLTRYELPEGSHMRCISINTARFKAPEGLLKTELMGVDSPTLPKLIAYTIQKCPMDVRKEMWQSIYLSGGTSLLRGFAERLQKELGKAAPPSVSVQVHASPHRYHAAYIGACMLAKLPNFMASCITRDQWKEQGVSALSKWKTYFQG